MPCRQRALYPSSPSGAMSCWSMGRRSRHPLVWTPCLLYALPNRRSSIRASLLLQPAQLLGGFDREQLVEEITAQIRKIQSAGIEVTHLDSHKHAHIFPEILTAMLRAARICGVRAIRSPFVPMKAIMAQAIRRQAHPAQALWPSPHPECFRPSLSPANETFRPRRP